MLLLAGSAVSQDWKPMLFLRAAYSVQPMTGIVLWADHEQNATDAIALEFSYMSFAAVSPSEGVWNWKPVDSLLDAIASRKHQAILRFRYEYVGEPTTVPEWIRAKPGYQETKGKSEGLDTWFSDWRSSDLKKFTLDFHNAFAARYQDDSRLAFVQVGFGLWAEYHIYDGPMELGRTFPDKAFQAAFFAHLDTTYKRLPWSVSVDAASEWAPFDSVPALKDKGFGLFDDSFMHQTHDAENRPNWLYFGEDRWKTRPAGGEISYFTENDQKHALYSAGLYGRTFESQAARYHISYMIGSDQPSYHTMARIKQASMATGYRFKAVSWEAKSDSLRLRLTNTGVAPLYRDAYLVGDVGLYGGTDTSKISLRTLMPGDTMEFRFRRGISAAYNVYPGIVCKHCVPGQNIQIEADLSGGTGVIAQAGRTGDIQWRMGAAGWFYSSTKPAAVAVRGLDGRLVWRGVLASSSGQWSRAPFGNTGFAHRFVTVIADPSQAP